MFSLTIRNDVSYRFFSYIPFIRLREFHSIPGLLSFYHAWILNFVKFFFCICLNDHIFFIIIESFNLVSDFC